MPRPDGKAPWLLARFAQGAIAAVVVADVFRLVAVRGRLLHPTDASLSTSGFASMVFVYLTTLAVVLFLLWLGRCRRNAEVLSPGTAAVNGFWAVVAWLIPLVNLWVPRQFVLDIDRASAGPSAKGRNTALVNAWWVALVAHTVVGAVEVGAGQEATIGFIVVSAGLNTAAAVLAVCVIERLTAQQGAALRAVSPVEPLAHA
jgi:hypothetical protein